MKIEDKLSGVILRMIVGNFDRWRPDAPPKVAEAMMLSAQVTAKGIAEKLVAALRKNTTGMHGTRWRKMVSDATKGATIEVPGGGPATMGPNFAAALAGSTAWFVAPKGSEWARDCEAAIKTAQAAMAKCKAKYGKKAE